MKFNPVSKILWVFIGIAVFIVAAILFFGGYEKWQKSREIREFNELLVRPYKEDIYGGDTPQETYEMFLQALRDEDVEMAAKMFVVEKQEEWLEDLLEIKNKKQIDEFLETLPEWQELQEKDREEDNVKEFYRLVDFNENFIEFKGEKIPVEYPKGYQGRVAEFFIFSKNEFTNKWKIKIL